MAIGNKQQLSVNIENNNNNNNKNDTGNNRNGEIDNDTNKINNNTNNTNNDTEKNIDNINKNNNISNTKNNDTDSKLPPAQHTCRRIYHVSTFVIIPVFFYWFAQPISDFLGISIPKFLSIVIIIQIVLEGIRLKKEWTMFGMRSYERNHISAQAWGTIGICIVFLLAYPRHFTIFPVHQSNHSTQSYSLKYSCYGQIGIPIIWTLGIGDPLLGELRAFVRRHQQVPFFIVYVVAYIVISFIWIFCYLWCGTPFWLAIIMPAISIAAEKPKIAHIDDNGLMLLIPLLFTLLFESWFPHSCQPVFY